MEGSEKAINESRKELIRLLKDGRLETVKREIFGKGVLAMLDSGEFGHNLNLSLPT